ncbi:MAG: nickel insertion protein [Bilophila wadsworthia]
MRSFAPTASIPVPAPAVLELLEGIPVRPFSGEGETVTPTAIALLRSRGDVRAVARHAGGKTGSGLRVACFRQCAQRDDLRLWYGA